MSSWTVGRLFWDTARSSLPVSHGCCKVSRVVYRRMGSERKRRMMTSRASLVTCGSSGSSYVPLMIFWKRSSRLLPTNGSFPKTLRTARRGMASAAWEAARAPRRCAQGVGEDAEAPHVYRLAVSVAL